MAYNTTRRILYGCNKTELARKTGMTRGTIFNRQKEPEKTTILELAQIAKVRGLTAEEVQAVLEDLA